MKREKLSKAAASGVVALIFLILGFQAAIFTGNVFRYNREQRIDTVHIDSNRHQAIAEAEQGRSCDSKAGAAGLGAEPQYNRHQAIAEAEQGRLCDSKAGAHGTSPQASGRPSSSASRGIAKGIAPRQEPGYGDSRRVIAERLEKKPEPELFQFDPNTVSREDLVRLGFSQKQAQVIENYRNKGGKYSRPRDFAKMYVVDSVMYARLEPYIRIQKINLNTADSLQLVSLKGIGPWYAHKILEYRFKLGGVFTGKEQLLEIEGIDAGRLSGFEAGVEVKPVRPRYTLWTATKGELAAHPYIGSYIAKGILRYKSVADTTLWTLSSLVENGVLTADAAARLEYLDIRP